jgi:hypothetical protein
MRTLILGLLLFAILTPAVVLAQDNCTPGYTGTQLCNALPVFGGRAVSDVPSFIAASMSWLATVIGTLALVMIIFAGAQMIFSQGDPQGVTRAKASMTYAIYGLVLVLFAYVVVSGVQYWFGFSNNLQPGQIQGGFFVNPLRYGNLMSFIVGTMRSALGLLGTAAMLFIVISGFRYVTSGGNEETIKKARSGMTWAILGLVSVVLSYLIISAVVNTVFRSAA